ncbi:MAG: cysteine--tRNA ligase [Gammaproteobacteria bacterium]|nr:cysteine--tRNA ligase [Gammaproteobacteria bacterium]
MFPLKIYNSATKRKEIFKPIVPGKVNMYVCGITVYDFCHIGHARTMTSFDVIVRYLRYLNYEVKYVRNITDIDDKIIKRANERGEDYQVLTDRFIQAMHEDFDRLNLLHPDEEPKATAFIDRIIQMIQTLLNKGYAYVGENGDVYYDVDKFKPYGQLAHRKLKDLQAGARVEVSEHKKNPLDFVLWKLAKPEEPKWPSPWGAGRPGWHIECSAMSTHCLANHIDIHGGGMDLLFPHHENEIAQSEAATNERFVNYWVHVAYLQIDHQKMSKSLGNFFTIREVLDKYDPEVVRYFLLSAHYRSPLSYSEDNLEKAKQGLTRLYKALVQNNRGDMPMPSSSPLAPYQQHFMAAMDDDFNTPKALAVLFDLAREINKNQDPKLIQTLRTLGAVLGILQRDPQEFLNAQEIKTLSPDQIKEIEAFIEQRNQARREKNWAKADKIRNQLKQMGVELEDKEEKTEWRYQG